MIADGSDERSDVVVCAEAGAIAAQAAAALARLSRLYVGLIRALGRNLWSCRG